MKSYPYRIVNVFAREGRLTGNPLCVFEDGTGLDDATQQALAGSSTSGDHVHPAFDARDRSRAHLGPRTSAARGPSDPRTAYVARPEEVRRIPRARDEGGRYRSRRAASAGCRRRPRPGAKAWNRWPTFAQVLDWPNRHRNRCCGEHRPRAACGSAAKRRGGNRAAAGRRVQGKRVETATAWRTCSQIPARRSSRASSSQRARSSRIRRPAPRRNLAGGSSRPGPASRWSALSPGEAVHRPSTRIFGAVRARRWTGGYS